MSSAKKGRTLPPGSPPMALYHEDGGVGLRAVDVYTHRPTFNMLSSSQPPKSVVLSGLNMLLANESDSSDDDHESLEDHVSAAWLSTASSDGYKKKKRSKRLLPVETRHGKHCGGCSQREAELTKTIEENKAIYNYDIHELRRNKLATWMNSAEELEHLKEHALQGSSRHQFRLAWRFETGIGMKQNWVRAMELLTAAANGGFVQAMYNLAMCMLEGHGTPADLNGALLWLRKCEARDYPPAVNNMGCLIEEGRGLPQSYKDALEMYERAADRCPEAAYNAAVLMVWSPHPSILRQWRTAFRLLNRIQNTIPEACHLLNALREAQTEMNVENPTIDVLVGDNFHRDKFASAPMFSKRVNADCVKDTESKYSVTNFRSLPGSSEKWVRSNGPRNLFGDPFQRT